MKEFLIFLWQLPQNFLGLLLITITKAEMKERVFEDKVIPYYIAKRFKKYWSGVSLGRYIVFTKEYFSYNKAVLHEYGHQRQSLYLGWLYLIVIGLPSVTGNLIDRFAHKTWTYQQRTDWYYKKLIWEKSADFLGGVIR